MQEEYHGVDPSTGPFKQLYGWDTLNTNVWLPSLSELVGTDPNHYYEPSGCYFSAMQGMNLSDGLKGHHVDAQGGNQFAYFKQYNVSNGGEKLWSACNQQSSWLRSNVYALMDHTWRITNPQQFDWTYVTGSYAVHPAVLSAQIAYRSLSPERQGEGSREYPR